MPPSPDRLVGSPSLPGGVVTILPEFRWTGEAKGKMLIISNLGIGQSHFDHFRQVQRCSAGALGDLFPATETVSDNQAIWSSLADGRQQFQLSDGNGRVVFVGFEPERSGHSAAAGGWSMEI